MGFFSSRRAEDNDDFVTTNVGHGDKSVAHVIRSRFYGKNKGKEREEQASFTPHGISAAHTLSNVTLSTHAPRSSSPLAGSSPIKGGSNHLRGHHDRSLPTTPSRNRRTDTTMPPPPSSSSQLRHGSPSRSPKSPNSSTPRKTTDTVTMTLAQRLNELAVANSEGLLNDDEYRLLRQNLFERFASSTVVPTEASVVPVARPRPRGTGSLLDGRTSSRPLSNFQVEVPRSPSIRSKSSITSGVTNLLRRATGRRPSGSNDYSDTSSVFSSASTQSLFKIPQVISHKPSNSSMRPDASRVQLDNISRRIGVGSDRSFPDHLTTMSLNMSRSNTSIRRFATPPSSFPARVVGDENKYMGALDEDQPKTAQEIRQEILAVESEAKRLMDAFHGLELTTLTRVQRRQRRQLTSTDDGKGGVESTWTLIPDGQSQRRVTIVDNDALSMRSGTSAGTTPSMPRSPYSNRKAIRSKPSLNTPLAQSSRPGSLHRKNSISSMTSQEKKMGKDVPPVPALPHSFSYGTLGVGNGSNISLARSAAPSTNPPSVRMAEAELENEMDDIRKQKEEVQIRYEARLEYLRAKLKGAQLHEKLLKK